MASNSHKILNIVTGIVGVAIFCVCIYAMAKPYNIVGVVLKGAGDSPKVGISAAVFMILGVIGHFFLNMENKQHIGLRCVVILVCTVLCIAAFSLAIRDINSIPEVIKNNPPFDDLLTRLKVVAGFTGFGAAVDVVFLVVAGMAFSKA